MEPHSLYIHVRSTSVIKGGTLLRIIKLNFIPVQVLDSVVVSPCFAKFKNVAPNLKPGETLKNVAHSLEPDETPSYSPSYSASHRASNYVQTLLLSIPKHLKCSSTVAV